MAVHNHTGQVVADLERASRFYTEVLGFRHWHSIELPDEPTAQLLGLSPPLGVRVEYLTLEGFVLELFEYTARGATASRSERSLNEPGLTHLSVSVEDIHATAVLAVRHGGQVVDGSDIGAALFIRDPDGQLVELLPASYRDSLPPKP